MSEIVETLPWEGDVLPFRGLECKQVNARPGQPPIVILPGHSLLLRSHVGAKGEQDKQKAGCAGFSPMNS